MIIRNATPNDIEPLALLKKPKIERHLNMFRENQINRLDQMAKGEVIYLLAEDNDQIIGHVLLKLSGTETEPGYPDINDLYVLEEKRGQGVGTKLIEAAEIHAKEKGFNKISLAVNPTLNPDAMRLYERLGYKQTETETYLDGVYDGDEDWVVDMTKDL